MATALTAALTAAVLRHGARLAFLTPGSDGAREVHRRIGHVEAGEQWHVRREAQ